MRRTLAALAVLAALTACRDEPPAPPPTPASPTGAEATDAPPVADDVILEERFDDNSAGWLPDDLFVGDNAEQEIAGGRYRILVTAAEGRAGIDSRGLSLPNAAELASLGDVRVEVLAERSTNVEDHFYGVTCRAQDFDNFYGFVVVEGGSFSIFEIVDGVTEELAEGSSPFISTGDVGSNVITAECTGSTLTLSLNGQEVATAQDDTFARGAIGLLAETRGQPNLEVFFDSLVVTAT